MCPWGWKAIKFPSDPWRQFWNVQYVKWDCFCICMFNLFLLKTITKDHWTMIPVSNELVELFSIDSHRFTVRFLLLLGKCAMCISLNELTFFPHKKRCNHTFYVHICCKNNSILLSISSSFQLFSVKLLLVN